MNITRRIHLNPQSKGNLGKSFEAEFRTAWLDRLGIRMDVLARLAAHLHQVGPGSCRLVQSPEMAGSGAGIGLARHQFPGADERRRTGGG